MCIAGLCLPVIYWIAILIMILVVIADPIGALKGVVHGDLDFRNADRSASSGSSCLCKHAVNIKHHKKRETFVSRFLFCAR